MGMDLTPAQINEFLQKAYPAAFAEGIRCEDIGAGYAIARWPHDEETLRPGRYISGPVLFGLADVALWVAGFTATGIETMAVTSEMSMRFLRPARNGDLLAKASINNVSHRHIVGTIELWIDGQPDKLVAVAQGTYARP